MRGGISPCWCCSIKQPKQMIWIQNLVWKMICLIDTLGNQFKSSHNASGWLLDDSGEEKKKQTQWVMILAAGNIQDIRRRLEGMRCSRVLQLRPRAQAAPPPAAHSPMLMLLGKLVPLQSPSSSGSSSSGRRTEGTGELCSRMFPPGAAEQPA